MLTELRKVIPAFLARVDLPDRGGRWSEYLTATRSAIAAIAELLTERTTLDQDLWDAFHARRVERARTVVDASNQIARWQLEHVQGDIPGLMRSIAVLTSQPG